MADFSKFRTAVSGFNRTDVVNYIESTSIEHQKALRKLTDERDKLAAENARLQVELAGLQKRLEQAQADNDALSGQVNALAQEGSDLAEQLKKAEEGQQELLTRRRSRCRSRKSRKQKMSRMNRCRNRRLPKKS